MTRTKDGVTYSSRGRPGFPWLELVALVMSTIAVVSLLVGF